MPGTGLGSRILIIVSALKESERSQVLVAHACILATQEAEMRRTMDQSQLRQIVCETLSQKYPSQKRAGRVA
jgi:hypothetical protein